MTFIRYTDSNQVIGLCFLIFVCSTIVLLSWMVISWMKDASHLLLSQMMIVGERYYTTNNNIRQVILKQGSPGTFITQNVKVIQQQIECMPWIKQASVRKQWPDKLKIHLVEYSPISRWNDSYLLDSSGKVFSAPLDQYDNRTMPMLYGPEGTERDVLTSYFRMNEILIASKFYIKTVTMNARHSWQLILKDHTRLELGRNDRIQRLKRFIWIYPILLQQAQRDNKRIDYVDLRYDSGLAVGWISALSN